MMIREFGRSARLPLDGQVSIEIIGLIETSGVKTNTAEVTAVDQFDPNSEPDNNDETEDDQASVTIDPPVIDLSLDKQIDIERPNVGTDDSVHRRC